MKESRFLTQIAHHGGRRPVGLRPIEGHAAMSAGPRAGRLRAGVSIVGGLGCDEAAALLQADVATALDLSAAAISK